MHTSEYPDNTSGCCLISGVATDPEGFLNLEVAANPANARGSIVLSVTKLRELGSEVGLFQPHEVQELRQTIAGLKLELELVKDEREQFKNEADALYTLAGPKLWAKAQHIRKNAGFWGRKRINAIQQFAKDEITAEEFDEAQNRVEEELCSTAS